MLRYFENDNRLYFLTKQYDSTKILPDFQQPYYFRPLYIQENVENLLALVLYLTMMLSCKGWVDFKKNLTFRYIFLVKFGTVFEIDL